jgi:hypothetical protein
VRRQQLLRSRVFELQYSQDGPYDVPPLKRKVETGEIKMPEPADETRKRPHKNSNIVDYNAQVLPEHRLTADSAPNTWPLCGIGSNVTNVRPCRDAYDIIMELTLGFHSHTGVPDVRIGTVPICFRGYTLDLNKTKCTSII